MTQHTTVVGLRALWLSFSIALVPLLFDGCLSSDQGFRQAILDGDQAKISALLARGANVEVADEQGMTPLLLAIKQGRPDVVELLLNHGADIHHAAHDGVTPLFLAIRERRSDLVALLLDKGADVNTRGAISGVTPLHVGAYTGDTEILRLLLRHGANKQARMTSGELPVDLVRPFGRTELIELLEP
jgi:ankyrin repeat protein